MIITIPRTLGGTLLIDVTIVRPVIQYSAIVTWVTRDMQATWKTRDNTITWVTRDENVTWKGRG